MVTSPNERWQERIAAKNDLMSWIEGGLRLEKAAGSAVHKLWDAEEAGRALWLLAPLGMNSNMRVPRAQSFVVQHDWAAAFEGAADFEEGDFQLPYDICCFEFRISGRRVCAFVQEMETKYQAKKAIMVLVEVSNNFWVMPITVFRLHEGMWQPVIDDSDDTFEALPRLVAAQVRAICISLEAEVAAKETTFRPEKVNRARERRGKAPLPPYHVLYLNNRPRSLMIAGEPGSKKRLHFRRGHWRNLDEIRRTWVRWCLVGDPNLGFIDKEYRL